MTGEQIYKQFKTLFPNLVYDLKSFTRKDPHTIVLKTRTNFTYIFTYLGVGKFMLKTDKFKEED